MRARPRPSNLLTLWFASNTSVAKYAIGLIPAFLGLPPLPTFLALLSGNAVGAAVLGLASGMGPKTGLEQIKISRLAFRGWRVFAVFNYLTTLGWFVVNIVLGSFALGLLGVPVYVGMLVVVAVDGLVAFYGTRAIHAFERAMTFAILALSIAVTAALAGKSIAFPSRYSPEDFWAVFLSCFGAIASWSPYASDYTKDIDVGVGKSVLYTLIGAVIPSTWLSMLGYLSALYAGRSSPIADVALTLGYLASLGVLAMLGGVVSADALNLYTNSVSFKAIAGRETRLAIPITAALGYAVALAVYRNFLSYLIDFLSALGYWISPWIGVLIARVLMGRRAGWPQFLASLALGLAFMNLTQYGIPYISPIAKALGGIDISQLVMLIAPILLSRPGTAANPAGPV
ncbi:MAG: purine-cytosine permease family protein [Thermoproteus sp. AZ2]|uniref:Purine-cytosine permease family protein n=1 Tax=Thermoproteus sp. AZ2 TaxID=1609232 RepID=A0ACC6V384_9CREN